MPTTSHPCPSLCVGGLAAPTSDIHGFTHRPSQINNPSTKGTVSPTNHPTPTGADCVNLSKEAHECSDCGGGPAHKPIAHEDALDEPIGHLCLMCYASWSQLTDYSEECVICGDQATYHTVREISDFDGDPILTTGMIGACEKHALECADVRIAPSKELH